MYAIVSLFSQSFDDFWFTYKIGDWLKNIVKPWMIVLVEFWNKITHWIILKLSNKSNIDNSKIKQIINIQSEYIFLNDYQLKLLPFISKNYFCLIHHSTNLFFPKNLIWKIIKNKFTFNTYNELIYSFNYKKTLNNKQNEILKNIIKSDINNFLLHWVTWSWKTEIYINLIKHYLDLWKQSLLLVPEIILTNQILERLKKVFWDEIIIINSTVSEAKKTKYRDMIYQNKAKIIIWTRSALFYPYNNLWIIIIDEEHDNSYISDITPRYDSIELAIEISKIKNNKLLLWSWTPKISHFYSFIKNNKYKVLNLFTEY